MGTNQIVVEGRLTKDAEHTVFGQNATPKLSFSLANNTGYGDYEKTNFFNCEIIGKTADSLSQYMLKGKAVNLVGEMQQQRWEDADGKKHNKWLILVSPRGVSFTSGSKAEGDSSPPVSKPAPASHQEATAKAAPPSDPFAAALAGTGAKGADEFDDSIPF